MTSGGLLVHPFALKANYGCSPCNEYSNAAAACFHTHVAAMGFYGLEYAPVTDIDDEGEAARTVPDEGFPVRDTLARQVAGDIKASLSNPPHHCCGCTEEVFHGLFSEGDDDARAAGDKPLRTGVAQAPDARLGEQRGSQEDVPGVRRTRRFVVGRESFPHGEGEYHEQGASSHSMWPLDSCIAHSHPEQASAGRW